MDLENKFLGKIDSFGGPVHFVMQHQQDGTGAQKNKTANMYRSGNSLGFLTWCLLVLRLWVQRGHLLNLKRVLIDSKRIMIVNVIVLMAHLLKKPDIFFSLGLNSALSPAPWARGLRLFLGRAGEAVRCFLALCRLNLNAFKT